MSFAASRDQVADAADSPDAVNTAVCALLFLHFLEWLAVTVAIVLRILL